MKKVDALIIGSSAAGFAAAITARRHYPDASLALIRQEEKTLVPCGIPYIFGTLGSPEKNLMPDSVLARNNVELIVDRVTEWGLIPCSRPRPLPTSWSTRQR